MPWPRAGIPWPVSGNLRDLSPHAPALAGQGAGRHPTQVLGAALHLGATSGSGQQMGEHIAYCI